MTHNSEKVPLAITLEAQAVWAAFDALPRSLRDEIAHAAFEYDAIAILEDYRACTDGWPFNGMSTHEYLQVMKDNFRRDLLTYSTTKVENGKYRLSKRPTRKVHVRQYPKRADVQAGIDGHYR